MSRIRSIHPGQWTDEAFVECSMAARLLSLALRNEADDSGIFEWKPTQIKMRLFPIDSVNITDLLAELEKTGQIKRYEVGGKAFGMIRNFGKYQSPRRPSSIYPKPDNIPEWQSFTCIDSGKAQDLDAPSSVNDGNDNRPGEAIPANVGKAPGEGVGGEGRGEGKGEEKERKARPYAFEGKFIKLNQADFDTWKSLYHSIPDIKAELSSIDSYFQRNGGENWFQRTSFSLNKKHQELLIRNPPSPPKASKQDMASRQAAVMKMPYDV